MIKINQVKCHVSHTEEQLLDAICKKCGCKKEQINSMQVLKRSIDARKKPQLFYLYTVLISLKQEEKVLRKNSGNRDISKGEMTPYHFPVKKQENEISPYRPVVIGAGPAGLFCAYELAMAGFEPIVLERGMKVEERTKEVEKFWKEGILSPVTNVQFGEGGAGTFSDGKLNTLVKDPSGRNRHVLETFINFGGPKDILYDQKPHLGTDTLLTITRNLRNAILAAGGEIRFKTQVTDFQFEELEEKSDDGIRKIRKLKALELNHHEILPCQIAVLAIGHSARDTFETLFERKIEMQAKPFAVGYRVIHPQKFMNQAQYGSEEVKELGAAPYKVTARAEDGRGVYSFCMCPGGYVVNASSEPGKLAVNGMSYSGRNGKCANSAIIVAISPDDYNKEEFQNFMEKQLTGDKKVPEPLMGIAFQREMERRAYEAGEGKIPIEKYGNFKKDMQKSGMILKELPIAEQFEAFEPSIKGQYQEADLSQIMPNVLQKAFVEGMEQINRHLKGFSSEQTWMCAVESRTSSPIRILRDDNMQTATLGLYPCGEGAGYAGGITSAAMDGIKVAEQIALHLYDERK